MLEFLEKNHFAKSHTNNNRASGKSRAGRRALQTYGTVTGAPTRIIMILIRKYSTLTASVIFVLNTLVDSTPLNLETGTYFADLGP